MVCLVRASWLLCTLSSSACPAGSVCLSLKKSTSVCGFFQSTWMETSVWPRTWISSIAETSGKDKTWTSYWKSCIKAWAIKSISRGLLSHKLMLQKSVSFGHVVLFLTNLVSKHKHCYWNIEDVIVWIGTSCHDPVSFWFCFSWFGFFSCTSVLFYGFSFCIWLSLWPCLVLPVIVLSSLCIVWCLASSLLSMWACFCALALPQFVFSRLLPCYAFWSRFALPPSFCTCLAKLVCVNFCFLALLAKNNRLFGLLNHSVPLHLCPHPHTNPDTSGFAKTSSNKMSISIFFYYIYVWFFKGRRKDNNLMLFEDTSTFEVKIKLYEQWNVCLMLCGAHTAIGQMMVCFLMPIWECHALWGFPWQNQSNHTL